MTIDAALLWIVSLSTPALPHAALATAHASNTHAHVIVADEVEAEANTVELWRDAIRESALEDGAAIATASVHVEWPVCINSTVEDASAHAVTEFEVCIKPQFSGGIPGVNFVGRF